MRQKRIMVLGGNIVQMEAIKEAKRLGYYVISADLHEDNPGHRFSDEYCKVDIINKEAVLREARRLKIDGIIPYSSDTLAPIAAYVAEQMGLPHNPYRSIEILTHKDLFRTFLKEHGFAAPWFDSFSDIEKACGYLAKNIGHGSAIMKPVDSSGSRGVFVIHNCEELRNNWKTSIYYSTCKKIIIEQFIEKKGPEVDGDIFLKDGKIIFAGFMDQNINIKGPSSLVPISLSYPSIHKPSVLDTAVSELQRLFSLLGMESGPCNVEFIVGNDDEIFFLDLGPRNGGANIPFLEKCATGFDENEFTIKSSVAESLPTWYDKKSNPDKYLMYYRPFASEEGTYRGLWMSDFLGCKVTKVTELMSQGDKIHIVHNGNDSSADVFAEFETQSEMLDTIKDMDRHLRVIVE